jgi:hypothetical protein
VLAGARLRPDDIEEEFLQRKEREKFRYVFKEKVTVAGVYAERRVKPRPEPRLPE